MSHPPSFEQHLHTAQGRLQTLQERFATTPDPDPALLTLFAELTDALEDLTIASEGLAQQNQRLKARQRSLRAERQRYHQAEVALQTSERRYDDLIQIAPVGIFWFDLDGQCTYVNPAWGVLTGYPIETAWGLGWLQTVHPDDQAALLTNLQQWLAAPGGHPHQDEARIVRPDGTVRWFYAQISPDYGGDGTLRGYVGSLTDVTDRKQAETTLTTTQDSLELALEAAEMGTWSLDLTQDVAPCRSLRHDQIFGYSTPQAEWGQEIAKRHVLEADREIFDAAFAHALTTGNLDFEVRIRWPDGSIHWMASRGRFFFDAAGHPLWAHGINYDITARKQAEAALRANERKLKAIFNSTFQLMGLLTIDGLLIDANQAALTLIEAELADVVGQPFWETPWWTDFPEQQQTLQGAIARAAQGEFVRLETRHRWADGSLAWVDFSLKPVRDEADNIVMLVPEGRDITARKQAELALQQSEATFRNFAENSRAVIWIAEDPQSLTHAYVNPAFADIWGQPWAAVNMQPDGWAQTIHPDDRDQATRQFAQERTGIFHPMEYRILRPDGTIRWIRDQGFPIRNAAGDIYLFGGIAQDITAHKEAEAALHQREEFLSTIFTGAEQAIFVIEVTPGPEFRFLEFNPVAERYSALTTAQVKGQTPEAAFGATIGAAMRHHYEACVVAGDKTAYEEHLVFPHQTLWTLTTLFPLRDEDGHIHRLVGTAIDISDRKHLELSLQASEAKLSQILDSAIIAISSFRVYADYNFEYEYWSAGCERLYGYPLSAYRDRDFWLSKVVAEDREQILMPLFADFFAERDVTVEYRFWRQDGALRWFASTYTARQITPTCWMVTSVNHDITDRKQAELTLKQQIRQEYLLADIAQDIRRSLNLTEVLTHTVERVRDFLHTDRVVLFRFRPDWQGDVIMESVGDGWLSLVGTTFHDPCFAEHYIQPYCRGHVSLMTDIDEGDRAPCYVELLRPLQVKASLAVPILQGEQLWGLLIAHHCVAPRTWQPAEIALLRRLATQVGIAIQQSELYGQTRRELLERQRMQQVIEESEERFRTLSTAAPVGICQTTADGICLYTNTRWQEMSGLSFADSLGDGWQRAIHPGDRAAVLHAWETHLANQGECQAEFRLLTPQGQTRWVAVRAATIQAATGEAIGSVCVYADITEQKETAQKVQEQAALLDIASDAIFVRDLDNRIIYWNQGAERLYGWAAAEAVGQPADQLLRAADPAIAAILAKLSPQDEWQGEICNTTRTGQQVTVASRWTLVRDEAGQPRSILTVDTDVTEKKQLQAQFYRAQRLESLGRLSSGIAHDLNNVFTPILALAQVLRLTQQNLTPKAQDQLQLLEKSAKRGASLVQQMLSVTRSSTDERQPLDLVPLLWEIVRVAQESFPQAIAVVPDLPALDAPAGTLSVSADSTQLHQVLLNLCVNARDAMPDGGTLTITAAPLQVDATLAQAHLDAQVGPYVVVTVADTGTGITPEVRDRMFDPFFTTKEPGKGTGLGLAAVLGIVRNHGGFVQVVTTPGSGTQMKIYLPAIAPVVPAPAPALPPPQWVGNGELILIVEDDLAVQQTTQVLLESHHYNTLTASNGMAAIALYTQYRHTIKLVILDVTMPSMNGVELIQRLIPLNPAIQIIAISGLPQNREPTLAAGATAFLAKPYSLNTLTQKIWELLHPTP